MNALRTILGIVLLALATLAGAGTPSNTYYWNGTTWLPLQQPFQVTFASPGTAPDTGNGATTANTPRFTLSNDSTSFGNPADVSWTGSGNCSLIACLKGIFNSALVVGTAGTPSAQVVSVQGVASGTTLPVTAAGSVASAATDSGNPVKTAGVYNSTPPTFTNGQRGDTQIDAKGSAKVLQVDGNGATVDPTAAVQTFASNSYVNVTTKTNTQAKSAAGTLVAIVVNASGSADTLTIYDNTSCATTIIGTVTVPATTSYRLQYDVAFGTGLCVTSGGTTAGNYTIVYR